MNLLKSLFAFVLVFGLAFAGISVTSYSLSQPTYKPGTSGVITMTITNPESATGTSYRMTGISATIYSPPELTMSSSIDIGDIEAGGSTLISLPFTIKSGAKSGIYKVDMRFTGLSSAGTTSGQDVYSKSVTIPITVVDIPVFTLTSDKGVIGGIEDVAITLANNGGPARNLRLKISETSPVAIYKTSEVYVGDLNGTSAILVTLDARSATDGAVDVPFTFTYEDELGISHSDTGTLRLTVKNEVLDLRFNQLSPLTTRKDGNLSLEVVNNGDALSDVKLSFTNASLRLKDKSDISIGDLSPGQKARITAYVYNDLSPGTNLVNAKIEWVEKDIRKEQFMDIPITIASDADVAVYPTSKPTPLLAGQEHTISVLVSNVGSYGIENVDVGIESDGLVPLDITPRQYIGSLAKGDFSTVQFKMRAASAGAYQMTINVRYRDASGEWITKTLTQAATVNAVPTADSGMLYQGIGAAVLLMLGLWYFVLRKKRGQEA